MIGFNLITSILPAILGARPVARTQSFACSIVGAIASTIVLCDPLLAADMPPAVLPASPFTPAVVAPPWARFYVGGHLGAAWTTWRTDVGFIAASPVNGASTSGTFSGPDGTTTSFVGGGQIGYNWQWASYVLGLEATISALGGRRNDAFNISSASLIAANLAAITTPVDGFVSNWDRRVEWLATFRARLRLYAHR